MPSLFYSATLYPHQSVQVAVEGISRANVTLIARDGCSDSGTACHHFGPWLSVLNTEATVKTVVIEATTYSTAGVEPFDLRVTMPIPPGAISVRTGARELITSEVGGGQATFEVCLTSPVIEPVDVPIASSDPAEGTASPATLHFTAENWQTPQTVAVTGVNDSARDGNRSLSRDRGAIDLAGQALPGRRRPASGPGQPRRRARLQLRRSRSRC